MIPCLGRRVGALVLVVVCLLENWKAGAALTTGYRRYHLSTSLELYKVHRDQCEGRGGHLLDLRTPHAQSALHQLMPYFNRSVLIPNNNFAIGMMRMDDVFVWFDSLKEDGRVFENFPFFQRKDPLRNCSAVKWSLHYGFFLIKPKVCSDDKIMSVCETVPGTPCPFMREPGGPLLPSGMNVSVIVNVSRPVCQKKCGGRTAPSCWIYNYNEKRQGCKLFSGDVMPNCDEIANWPLEGKNSWETYRRICVDVEVFDKKGGDISIRCTGNYTAPMEGTTEQSANMMEATERRTTVMGTTSQNTTMMGITLQNTTMIGTTSQKTKMMGTMSQNTTVMGTTPQNTTVMGTTLQNTTVMGTTLQNTTVMGTTLQNTTVMGTTPQNTTVMGTTSQNTIMMGTTLQNTTMMGTTPQNTTVMGTTLQNTVWAGTTTDSSTLVVGTIDYTDNESRPDSTGAYGKATQSTPQAQISNNSTTASVPGESCSRVCRCPAVVDKGRFIADILESLTLNKTGVSAYRRKYHSSPDERPSAIRIGYSGVFILISVAIILIVLDSGKLLLNVSHLRQEMKKARLTQGK